MDPVLDDLNPAQREAVEFGEGALMVVAGAGSGKTRVITRRIARLTRDGVPPESVLALTFTNKAAGEMARRVEELGGHRVHVATFHSAAARFLRRDGHHLGYPRDYTIYDTYDRDSCIKLLMEEMGLPLKEVRPAHVGRELSRLKNLSIAVEEYREAHDDDPAGTVTGTCARIYGPYQERMQRLGAMDFDDLLLRFRDLLRDHAEVTERYRDRYRWLLVDEFQDTNRVQYQLARLLAGDTGSLCVVGDPDQSIYRFRGAEIRNILDFQRDYPAARVINLETNYRSTQCILRAAQGLIAHNEERLERGLSTDNDPGDPLVYRRHPNPFEENDAVCREIGRLLGEGVSPREIAVFYRSHYLSRGIEEVLRRAGLPYEVIGGLSFFERREIKDLLAFLRVAVNPLDDVSMERIINVPPRGIGKATLEKLRRIAVREEMSLLEVAGEPELHGSLAGRARKSLAELARLFDDLRQQAEVGVAEALRLVLRETDYVEHACSLGDPQDIAREENIGELVNDAVDFEQRFGGGLADYLAHTSLLTSEDRSGRKGACVSLMSVHAAKGLEFDHVFVIGLEDGLFPSSRSLDQGDVEEERRLMYVALTRGRRTVRLSGCNRRMVQGYEVDQEPSRFLAEIPEQCMDRSVPVSSAWHTWEPEFDDAGLELEPGVRVSHPQYGEGVVERLSGQGVQARAVVRFGERRRELILEFARLQVLPGGESW